MQGSAGRDGRGRAVGVAERPQALHRTARLPAHEVEFAQARDGGGGGEGGGGGLAQGRVDGGVRGFGRGAVFALLRAGLGLQVAQAVIHFLPRLELVGYAGAELAGAERLDEVVVGAGVEAEQRVRLLRSRGEHDDVGVAELADAAGDLETVDVGQADIEGDDLGGVLADELDAGEPVAGCVDGESRLHEHELDEREPPLVQPAAHTYVVSGADGLAPEAFAPTTHLARSIVRGG